MKKELDINININVQDFRKNGEPQVLASLANLNGKALLNKMTKRQLINIELILVNVSQSKPLTNFLCQLKP